MVTKHVGWSISQIFPKLLYITILAMKSDGNASPNSQPLYCSFGQATSTTVLGMIFGKLQSGPKSEFIQQQEDQEPTTLLGHLNRIAEAETEVEPTPEDELAAQSGYTRPLSELPDGLFRKVMACGDRLVMLAPQLISNLTSNLAECYMGLRAICDGGKQYNRIQSGSFEHRCYAAGLQAQHGPQWGVRFWKGLIGEEPNQVCYCVPLLKYSTISNAIFTFSIYRSCKQLQTNIQGNNKKTRNENKNQLTNR